MRYRESRPNIPAEPDCLTIAPWHAATVVFPLCLGLVALSASDWFGHLLVDHVVVPSSLQLRDTIPLALVVTVGSLRDMSVRLVGKLRDRTRRLLLAVNALNLLDAALTAVAIEKGSAQEANPMVRWMRLPAKIVVVAAASVLIARYRPRALIWPVLLLTGVLVWHISGLALHTHL
jgi:hypothetical protein